MLQDNLSNFIEVLNWPVKNRQLYEEALTHSSYAYENSNERSNERLEFLGDAVLKLIISEYFFKTFPNYPEGKLTHLCHLVVNEVSLAQVAQNINLGSFLKLGKGEITSGGSKKPSLLADALEALIGALFLDLGYSEAKPIVLKLFHPLLEAVSEGNPPVLDFKTMLQEACQEKIGKPPVYFVINESGPSHDKIFEVGVKIDDKIIGRGKGKRKKDAEQSAAKAAWEYMEYGEAF